MKKIIMIFLLVISTSLISINSVKADWDPNYNSPALLYNHCDVYEVPNSTKFGFLNCGTGTINSPGAYTLYPSTAISHLNYMEWRVSRKNYFEIGYRYSINFVLYSTNIPDRWFETAQITIGGGNNVFCPTCQLFQDVETSLTRINNTTYSFNISFTPFAESTNFISIVFASIYNTSLNFADTLPTVLLGNTSFQLGWTNFQASYAPTDTTIINNSLNNINNSQQQTKQSIDNLNETQKQTNENINNLNETQKQTKESIDNVNNTLTNPESIDGTNKAGEFFSGFNSDTFGLTSIITSPLTLIGSLATQTCSPLGLPLPYVNKSLQLPCMSTIYSQYFGSFFSMYQMITFGVIAYWVSVRVFNLVKDFKNPDHDEIEVMDL